MRQEKIHLPESVGIWIRPESARIVTASNIFDYMNGAGELYLGYRFDRLEVYEYSAPGQDSILVEVYFMQSSDDAFGLLSQDWGGEPVLKGHVGDGEGGKTPVWPPRALYGEGLLRIWSDKVYARIMAYRETPESRKAVLALGEAMVAHRSYPPVPKMLQALPLDIGLEWKLRRDRMVYFRSYFVLNAFFFLSSKNILDLDHSVEAVTAPYEHEGDSQKPIRAQLLFLKYASSGKAAQAMRHFFNAYLPDHKKTVPSHQKDESINYFELEDGWLGYKLSGRFVVLVFSCPDKQAAWMIIEHTQF